MPPSPSETENHHPDEPFVAASADTAAAEGAATDTVELAGDRPPRPLLVPEDLDELLRHLDDACPVITSDPVQASEIHARYIILEEIGSGAIGQVIEAVDEHLSRRVAIKILHGGVGVSRDRLARFIAEAQITAQLDHPSIVPVYEIGRMPGGMPYFSMKMVEGESLDDILNHLRVGDEGYTDRWNTRALMRMFRRLCLGVSYAHHKGVVHRDLKPGNIMVGKYGEGLIMDWGLAKVMSGSPLEGMEVVHTVRDVPDLGTLDGAIAGTPAYMSPEQARGEVDRVGPESDVYSLGLILAELLTLTRVYRLSDTGTTLNAVRVAQPVDVTELNAKVKVEPELAAIVKKCTHPDPRERYAHAGALEVDIRDYLDHKEVAVSPDAGARKAVKWSRRHPMLAGILIGEVIAAAVYATGRMLHIF